MPSRAVAKTDTGNFVSEWIAAGATVGVLGPDSFLNRPRTADETLAFHFDKPVRVADLLRLPVPTEPFALGFREMDDDGIKGIARFHALRGLIVGHTQVGNKGVAEIVGCEGLRHLDICETPLTDAGAAYLAELSSLEYLSIWRGNYCRLGAKPMAFLASLRKLRYLEAGYTKFDDGDLETVSRLPNLISLQLFDASITNAGLPHLLRMKKLRNLGIGSTNVTGTGGVTLGKLKHLESLCLQSLRFGDDHLAPFANLRSLRELRLEGTHVTGEGLCHLSGLTELKKLNLWSRARIAEDGLDHLAGLRLTELLVHNFPSISPRFVERIAACHDPDVTELPLDDAPVGDAELKVLAKFKRLKKLSVHGDGLTDNGLRSIGKMIGLKSLEVSSEAISGDGLRALANLKHLSELVLRSGSVTDAAVAEVIAANRQLKLVRLRTPMGKESVRALRGLDSLRCLCLWDRSVTDAHLAELARAPALRELALVGTSVTPSGLASLQGKGLESLILDDQLETAAAFPHYLKALGNSPDALRLNKWEVENDDLVHLVNCPGLTVIHLDGSAITPAGVKHLHGLTRLKEVWLDGQKRWKAAIAALKKALPDCHVYE